MLRSFPKQKNFAILVFTSFMTFAINIKRGVNFLGRIFRGFESTYQLQASEVLQSRDSPTPF